MPWLGHIRCKAWEVRIREGEILNLHVSTRVVSGAKQGLTRGPGSRLSPCEKLACQVVDTVVSKNRMLPRAWKPPTVRRTPIRILGELHVSTVRDETVTARN
jgi:hypothetical protein